MGEILDKIKRKKHALDRKTINKDSEKLVIWVKTNSMNADELVEQYSAATKNLGGQVCFTTKKPNTKDTVCYCYEPVCTPMDELQMGQVAYCLLHVRYDFVVVSKSLAEYPNITTEKFEDVFVYWSGYRKEELLHPADGVSKCGRLLRLAGKNQLDSTLDLNEVLPDYRFEDEFRLKYAADDKPLYRTISVCKAEGVKTDKPVVFVLPIFMAVGGVERNTIETMRALQDKYSFVVITMERHMQAQGSLHDQLYGLCDAIYDIRELFEFSDYLNVLDDLKQIYSPKVVWLCNNSPWLENNALQVREIFKEQNFVVQDAYDTKYGWIEYYSHPEMKQFDNYIAINEKIKAEFLNTFNLPEEKIEVIYSLVDDKKIRKDGIQGVNRKELFKKYGLNEEKKHFALIGRMTEQKNPIRYLKLVQNACKKYDDIEFVLVGSGVLDEQVDAYIRENQLDDKLVRIPFVASTPELFRILDGLILTSVYEGLAIVSIEAMSLGVPVLSTDTGDLKLFIDKTKGGIIIPDSDTEHDIKYFDELISNYECYKGNAEANAQEILDFFSATNIAKQYQKIFEKK